MAMSNYEIVIKGYLDHHWQDYLGGLQIKHLSSGETKIFGSLSDQAAVYSAISKLRDMNLQLISINKMDDAKSSKGI